MDQSLMKIPFGISANGEIMAIPLVFPHRNHCFITGAPGSGKSTLLKVIVEAIERCYDKSQVVVWTDYFSHNNEKCQNDSVLEVYLPENITPEERMIALFESMYKEAQNRQQALSLNGISSYCHADFMPLLIAVIDDIYPLSYSDRARFASEKLWTVLRMSHAVGISLICTSQLPVSRVHGMTSGMSDLFNVRIALRTINDFILEALDINPFDISTENNEAIDSLSSGHPGDFLYHNRYEAESLVAGRVKLYQDYR